MPAVVGPQSARASLPEKVMIRTATLRDPRSLDLAMCETKCSSVSGPGAPSSLVQAGRYGHDKYLQNILNIPDWCCNSFAPNQSVSGHRHLAAQTPVHKSHALAYAEEKIRCSKKGGGLHAVSPAVNPAPGTSKSKDAGCQCHPFLSCAMPNTSSW